MDLEIVSFVFRNVPWAHIHTSSLDLESASTGLTERQKEVLAYLLNGESTKAIANRLALSHHTVCDYIKTLYKTIQRE